MHHIQSIKKPLCLLLSLLVFAASAWLLWTQLSTAQTKQIALNAEIWNADLDEGQSVPGIQIPGYGTIHFLEGQHRQQLTLYNPAGNPCYFEFVLSVDDQTDPIYSSDLVEPGKAITEVLLETTVPSGTHELSIRINTYALKDQSRMNGSRINTTLIVG